MLERSDAYGYSTIISWVSNGRLFKIYDDELFTSKIMKKYFIQTKFASFKRQLYFYGFRKVGKRFLHSGAYYHKLFSKGQLSMCGQITRCEKSAFELSNESRFFNQMIELDQDESSDGNKVDSAKNPYLLQDKMDDKIDYSKEDNSMVLT